MRVAFALSPVELELIDRGDDGLPDQSGRFDYKVIDYSRCLRKHVMFVPAFWLGFTPPCRRSSPGAVAVGSSNANSMIFVLSLNLSLQVDCALALISLVQWGYQHLPLSTLPNTPHPSPTSTKVSHWPTHCWRSPHSSTYVPRASPFHRRVLSSYSERKRGGGVEGRRVVYLHLVSP